MILKLLVFDINIKKIDRKNPQFLGDSAYKIKRHLILKLRFHRDTSCLYNPYISKDELCKIFPLLITYKRVSDPPWLNVIF